MFRKTVAVPGLLAALAVVALGACRDEKTPVSPGSRAATTASDSVLPADTIPDALAMDTLVRAHEQDFARIAQAVPGFAGAFIEQGKRIVLVTDLAQGPAAAREVEAVFAARPSSSHTDDAPVTTTEVRQARFPFLQLAAWRNRASGPVLDVDGVVYTDLDERQNRIVVGVSTNTAQSNAQAEVARAGVPSDAVVYERAEPVVDEQTVQSFIRPLEGGIQIAASSWFCTLGFIGNWNYGTAGYRVFITNSHCTSATWKTDGLSFFQNTNAIGNYVGYELYDRKYWKCGFLWLKRCRWSDAAVVRVTNATSTLGSIARTTGWAYGPSGVGSLTLNGHFKIIGELPFPFVGEMVDKVGRTTGWTYGYVNKTCVDTNASGGRRVLCQDYANYGSNGGDSGSPVFRWYGTSVKLYGVHWGRTGSTRIFSAMWNVETDLGGVQTF